MNLLRLILIVLAVWIVIVLLRNARARREVKPPRPSDKVENMVRCASCGLHLPEKDALRRGDRYYCCAAHRDKTPS